MHVIVKRKLVDYPAWKKLVTDLNQVRGEYGSKGATVYRSAADPNEVYMVFDWDDQKSYKAYFDRPDVQKALAETGSTEIIEVGETFALKE